MRKMKIEFSYDCNIFRVRDDVISELQSYDLSSMERRREELQKIRDRSCNPSDCISADTDLSWYDKIIPMVREGTLVKSYKHDIAPLLRRYKELMPNTIYFGCYNPNIPERVYTIIRFLDVTSDYIDLEWKCLYPIEKYCPECYTEMRRNHDTYICKICSRTSHDMAMKNNSQSDGKKTSTYNASKNFRKVYARVACMENHVDDEEIEDIKVHIRRSNVQEITHDRIREAIKACGYRNYDDTNYIYSQITGTPMPDISAYIDRCTDRFSKYFEIFDLHKKERRNITNINFLIDLFLMQEGVFLDEKYFKPLSRTTRKKHENMAKTVCQDLKKRYPNMLWYVYTLSDKNGNTDAHQEGEVQRTPDRR